jgi:hypothetical protein
MHMRVVRSSCRQALILILSCSLAWSWGPDGHQIIARMAALNLNGNAANQVAAILGVSVESVSDEMAQASTWADVIRLSRKETTSWHYVDIPLNQSAGRPDDFCANGDCVSFRLADFAKRLAANDPGPDQWTRLEQLKFLIHYAGDIHQPLHCATNSDKGANCIFVSGARNVNLHRVWDAEILAQILTSDNEMAQQLSNRYNALSDARKAELVAGTPDDWAIESHRIALSKAYGLVRPQIKVMDSQIGVNDCKTEAPASIRGLKLKLSPAYFTQTAPVVEEQLMKAGARLANMLNTIWPAS